MGGEVRTPTFWSGRTDLLLYKYTKSEILLGPSHFSNQSYATEGSTFIFGDTRITIQHSIG